MKQIHPIHFAPAIGAVRYPGLTGEGRELDPVSESTVRRLAVFSYLQQRDCIWILFVGGTGTGKSTLFNAFLKKSVSEAGVERPTTQGPIAYVHRECRLKEGFPFTHILIAEVPHAAASGLPVSGSPGHLEVLEHEKDDLSHLILVDTPDLDSIEEENRKITGDFYLLSDAVVYVTSQEKYADDVPCRFLGELVKQGKPYFFVFNKADEKSRAQDVVDALGEKEVFLDRSRIWLIPHTPSAGPEKIAECQAFRSFRSHLLETLSTEAARSVRTGALLGLAQELDRDAARLLFLAEQETKASEGWLTRLNDLSDQICGRFMKEQEERFARESQESLAREIRKLFARYDVLAAPRRFIRGVVSMPLRLLGFLRPVRDRREDLYRVRQKIDLIPVQEALDRLNRLVFERLSPRDESTPLFTAMRRSGVVLGEDEVEAFILNEEKRIEDWIKSTFEELAREIPAGKRWGIYSTSVVWGILILVFETAVGGGFTVLDAAVDSALAPFVTKGAVELFAAREIRKIAKELSSRYREALLSVLRLQRQRYEDCLRSLMTSPATLNDLRKFRDCTRKLAAELAKEAP